MEKTYHANCGKYYIPSRGDKQQTSRRTVFFSKLFLFSMFEQMACVLSSTRGFRRWIIHIAAGKDAQGKAGQNKTLVNIRRKGRFSL